ncbi:serine/threonine-protein kinase [Nocardiopsis sp. NPDC007018]|uniref:serine/threonine protein kinase n=1 Tax=Nocardiopsis sp. NPDC007018 TaxID=3155721 RepID=UPI0033C375E0
MSPSDPPPRPGPGGRRLRRRSAGGADASPLGAHDPRRLGPHRLLGRLGSGGMGTVYLGRTRFGGLVAVKAVHPELADEPEFRANFAREVESLRRVRSRFVPRFVAASPRSAIPWLATSYVDGPTLRERVRAGGPLRGGALTELAAGTAAALADIHAAGVVHRDLKPSNVILCPDGPRVLDFGIARPLDGSVRTGGGDTLGTPGWIAPERLHGAPATTASDVFSWGQLTVYAASGRHPFGRGDARSVLHRMLRGQADVSGVPAALLPLVLAALSPRPDHRPDARTVLRALGVTGAAAVTRATRDARSFTAASVGGASRHRRVLRRGAAVLAAAAVVTAGGAVGARHGSDVVPERISMYGAGEVTPSLGDVVPGPADWPPPEARETATAAGRSSGVRAGGGEPEAGSRAREDWAEFVLGGSAPDGATVRLSPPERSAVGVLVFRGEYDPGPASPYPRGFVGARFSVVTEERERDAVRPSGREDGAGRIHFTVGFEDAPDSGLLVVHEHGYGRGWRTAPAVGVCYGGADAAFSVDYSRCT